MPRKNVKELRDSKEVNKLFRILDIPIIDNDYSGAKKELIKVLSENQSVSLVSILFLKQQNLGIILRKGEIVSS